LRITLKKIRIIPDKAGFRLTIDVTLIKTPNWEKYAEILREYQDRKFGLFGAILMMLKAWTGIKRR
jgi:hypothetical protein